MSRNYQRVERKSAEVSSQDSLAHNDAEIAGLFVGAISQWEVNPPTGSPAWAVQEEVISRFGSREAYESYRADLTPEVLEGHVDNLKGHSFERWLEHHGEMEAHASPNFPGSDGVDPETGGLVEAKAGSREYIRDQRAQYGDDIEMHSSIEGDGIPGVTSHEVSETEFAGALHEINDDGIMSEVLGNSVAFGAVLSAGSALKQVQAGKIRLADAPRVLAADLGGRSARVLVIGTAVASGSPVLVATGAGWVAYRNRKAIGGLAKLVTSAVSHPTTKRITLATGRMTLATVRGTARGGWRASRWAASNIYDGVIHPTTRKTTRKVVDTAGKVGLRTKILVGRGLRKLGGVLAKRIKR